MSTGVRLNAPLHTEVVRLEAIDPDAESGPVFYKLLNVSFIRAHHYASSGGDTQIDSSPAVAKTFDLDTSSGLLTTSQTYGLFVDGYFLLHVCAWTGEESRSRKAFNTLKVTLHQYFIKLIHLTNLRIVSADLHFTRFRADEICFYQATSRCKTYFSRFPTIS